MMVSSLLTLPAELATCCCSAKLALKQFPPAARLYLKEKLADKHSTAVVVTDQMNPTKQRLHYYIQVNLSQLSMSGGTRMGLKPKNGRIPFSLLLLILMFISQYCGQFFPCLSLKIMSVSLGNHFHKCLTTICPQALQNNYHMMIDHAS